MEWPLGKSYAKTVDSEFVVDAKLLEAEDIRLPALHVGRDFLA